MKELKAFDSLADKALADAGMLDGTWDRLRPIVGQALLRLIDLYPGHVILQRRILLFKVTVTARDIREWVRWAFRL